MRIKNCQQFITDSGSSTSSARTARMPSARSTPLEIQGEFVVELEPMGESQMRQEKRAEAMQFFQVAMQAAPLARRCRLPSEHARAVRLDGSRSGASRTGSASSRSSRGSKCNSSA
jgi:hypothetical protein